MWKWSCCFFFGGGAFHVLSIIYTDKGNAPEAATSLMGLFCSLAMKPITEKMANPEKKLVPELMAQTSSDCLIKKKNVGKCKAATRCPPRERHNQRISSQSLCRVIWISNWPVDVVVVLVVASQGDKRTDSQTVGEEDLSHCINPYLYLHKLQ